MNSVTLFGNLGADPELRATQGGRSVLNMRLATTERYKGADGAWQERTDWHAVVLWGPRAEALAKLLRKGSRVLVRGSLRTSSYEKNGEKRYKTEINVDDIELGGDGGQRRDDEPARGYGGGGGGGVVAHNTGGATASHYGGGGGGASVTSGNGYGSRTKEPPVEDYDQAFGGGDEDIPF